MGDVVEFFPADIFELLAFVGEFFVNLDGLLGHFFVGRSRAPDQRKVGAGGDALVTIGVQADSQQERFRPFLLFPGRFRHGIKLGNSLLMSSFRLARSASSDSVNEAVNPRLDSIR